MMSLHRLLPAGLALAALALSPSAALAADEVLDWQHMATLDADDRALIESYSETTQALARQRLELSRRFPGPLLRLELSRDLKRLRWRQRDTFAGAGWREALICPEDREAFARLEGVLARQGARAAWIPVRLDGDLLLAPPAWQGRALLLRPDGRVVRLALLF